MRRALGTASACFAAYLLFAGTLSWSEASTGLVLCAIGSVAALVLTSVSERRFRFSASHLLVWARAIWSVPGATVRTAAALLRFSFAPDARAGRADVRPFRRGRDDASQDRARRATAVLAASLAPATFVVLTEPQRDTALLHGIDRTPPTADVEWLA